MNGLVADYIQLFRGRGDALGTWAGGSERVVVTLDHFANHLTSTNPADWIGVYPHLGATADQCVTWGCIDVDGKDFPLLHPCDNCSEYDEHTCHLDGEEYGPYTNGHDWITMFALARRLTTMLAVKDVYANIERTRNGYHLWVFPEGAPYVPAVHMRRALMAACKAANYDPKEVNPKSEELEKGKLGNYVRLPYYGALANQGDISQDRHFVDEMELPMSLPDFLNSVRRTTPQALEALSKLWSPPVRQTFDGPPPEDVEAILPVLSGKAFTIWRDGPLEGSDRTNTLARLAYTLEGDGIQMPAAFAVVKDADRRWGKFADRADCDEQIMSIIQLAYVQSSAATLG